MKKNLNKINDERSMMDIYNSFSENIKSVEIFFSRLSPIAESEDQTIQKERDDFFEKCLNEVIGDQIDQKKTKKGRKRLKLSKESIEILINKIEKAPNLPAKNFEILARSAFIMLNNNFEYLFSDLLTYHFRKNKAALNNKKISTTIEELGKYQTLPEAIEDIIKKEVDCIIMQLSFDELKAYFDDKLNIGLEKDLIDWTIIDEIRERRHLIIHNNSIVNNKYITKTKNPFNLQINSSFDIDNKYFMIALNEIKVAGTLLILNCWGNWDKENSSDAIRKITDFTFDNLLINDYESVRKLGIYSEKNIKPKNDEDDDLLHRIAFNYCIALKKLGKSQDLTKKLSSIKVGALSPIFKVASFILKDEYDKAVNILHRSKAVDDINIDRYNEWPIFESIRNHPKYDKIARRILSK